MAKSYPLHWPVRIPRTPAHERTLSRFGKSPWNQSLAMLRLELRRLGADLDYVTISTNQPIRNDGQPYAQDRRIDDPGVAVYFKLRGRDICFPCDRWLTFPENLRAITMHIEAMRGQQRWGVGTIDQAFAGYAALPASTEPDWWVVLGVDRSTATRDSIQAAYRTLARAAHSDLNGGSDTAMVQLNTARDRALQEVAQ